VSAELINEHDPNDPKGIGSADRHPLREKQVAQSHSHEIVHGGTKRKRLKDHPKTNAQLLDVAVKDPEAIIQQNVLKALHRTRRVPENQQSVTACYKTMYSTVSSGISPSKGKSDPCLRPFPVARHYARDRRAAFISLDIIAKVFRTNSVNFSLESLTGKQMLASMEATEGVTVHYADGKEN